MYIQPVPGSHTGSADKQRCETLSAQANLLRMRLLPFSVPTRGIGACALFLPSN